MLLAGVLALALGTFAFACGSDNGDQPKCEGAACEDGGGSEASTPTEAGQDGNVLADGGADADADSSVVPSCGDAGEPGTLDPTFGDGGIVWLKYPGSGARAVALQPDGKILIGGSTGGSSGSFALVRLLANGSLDTAFGTAGLVETKPADLNAEIRALALLADGRIVAVGSTRFTGQTADFAVLRYLPDGGLDTTFGTGGVVLTDFGAQLAARASSVAIQADGRILVGGSTDQNASPNGDYAIARYNVDGSLDSTLGTGGKALLDVRGPAEMEGLIALSSNKIVIGGASVDPNDATRSDISAVRVLSDGALDNTFAMGGVFVSSFGGSETQAFGAALDGTGRLLLGGLYRSAAPDDVALLRLTASGVLDSTWGDGGLVTADINGRSDVAAALVVQPEDGKIVWAGSSSLPGGGADTVGIALGRHLASGSLDPTFGAAGRTLTPPMMADTYLGASGAALGKCSLIVVGTWGYNLSTLFQSAMGVARYRR